MSSADIDEIYDRLVEIYEGNYPHNPRHVLSYKISELVREGRTRENAILTLYEREEKITRAQAEELEEALKKRRKKPEKREYKRSNNKLRNIRRV